MPGPLTYPEYPNAERLARSFGRLSLFGPPMLMAGIVLGITTDGAAQAAGIGIAVFGLWWFMVMWLVKRRSLRKLDQMREQASQRAPAPGVQ